MRAAISPGARLLVDLGDHCELRCAQANCTQRDIEQFAVSLSAKRGVADLELVSAGGVVTKLKLTQGDQDEPDHVRVAGVRLEIGFSISSSASLSIGAAVAAGVPPEIESTAGLRLTASAEIHHPPTVSAEADVHDVVLEMLLIGA